MRPREKTAKYKSSNILPEGYVLERSTTEVRPDDERQITRKIKAEKENIKSLLTNMISNMIDLEKYDNDDFNSPKRAKTDFKPITPKIKMSDNLYMLKRNKDNFFNIDSNFKSPPIPNLKLSENFKLSLDPNKSDVIDNSSTHKLIDVMPKGNIPIFNKINPNYAKQTFTTEEDNIPVYRGENVSRIIRKIKKVEDSVSSNDDDIIVNLEESRFVINSDGWFKKLWDSMIVIMTFYTLLVTPFMMAFIDDDIDTIIIFESIMDIIFIIDVVLQFFIPYYNENEICVKNLYLIGYRYVSTWFVLDLAASIPGTLISMMLGGTENTNRLGTINKAARLTKFYKILKFSKLLKIIKVTLYTILFFH